MNFDLSENEEMLKALAERFVLDRYDLDLYGKTVTLEYVEFIRPAAKFDGVESLVAEINRDIEKIRVALEIGEN